MTTEERLDEVLRRLFIVSTLLDGVRNRLERIEHRIGMPMVKAPLEVPLPIEITKEA